MTAATPFSRASWLKRARSASQIPRSLASWASIAAVSSFFTCTACAVGPVVAEGGRARDAVELVVQADGEVERVLRGAVLGLVERLLDLGHLLVEILGGVDDRLHRRRPWRRRLLDVVELGAHLADAADGVVGLGQLVAGLQEELELGLEIVLGGGGARVLADLERLGEGLARRPSGGPGSCPAPPPGSTGSPVHRIMPGNLLRLGQVMSQTKRLRPASVGSFGCVLVLFLVLRVCRRPRRLVSSPSGSSPSALAAFSSALGAVLWRSRLLRLLGRLALEGADRPCRPGSGSRA